MTASVSAREASQLYETELDVGYLFELRMEQFAAATSCNDAIVQTSSRAQLSELSVTQYGYLSGQTV